MNALLSPRQMRSAPISSQAPARLAKARNWIAAMVADGFTFALPPGSDPTNPNAYDLRRDGIDRSADLLAAIGGREGVRHG